MVNWYLILYKPKVSTHQSEYPTFPPCGADSLSSPCNSKNITWVPHFLWSEETATTESREHYTLHYTPQVRWDVTHWSHMQWGPNFVKMGTQFWAKWGPNGDLKTHLGPHGDLGPKLGTYVATVVTWTTRHVSRTHLPWTVLLNPVEGIT